MWKRVCYFIKNGMIITYINDFVNKTSTKTVYSIIRINIVTILQFILINYSHAINSITYDLQKYNSIVFNVI